MMIAELAFFLFLAPLALQPGLTKGAVGARDFRNPDGVGVYGVSVNVGLKKEPDTL
jgi:hypothetical protein